MSHAYQFRCKISVIVRNRPIGTNFALILGWGDWVNVIIWTRG
jgi:hypothetical protein